MAKKSTPKAAIGYRYGRLVEQSGGMVDAVVHPALLKDSEARLLKNVSIREKGTVKTTEGRKARFDTPFDASNPCNGLTAFYPDTTTSRLVMGAGSKLYSDTPHLITKWTDQADFEELGSIRTANCDTTASPGEMKIWTAFPALTFTRPSVAYLSNGTQVAEGVPRYENCRFGKGYFAEKGTTNLCPNPSVETNLDGWVGSYQCTIERDNTYARYGEWSAKVTTGSPGANFFANIGGSDRISVSDNTQYALSCDVRPYAVHSIAVCLQVVFWGADNSYIGEENVTGWSATGSGVWERLSGTFATPADTAFVEIRLRGSNTTGDGVIVHVDGVQLEQKPHASSFVEGTRAPEVLAIPTSGVFQKGNWSIHLLFKPIVAPQGQDTIWQLFIDSSNFYTLIFDISTKYLALWIVSSGVSYIIVYASLLEAGSIYQIVATGDGTNLCLYINGEQIGEVPYVEPVGTLPEYMYIGSNASGTFQADGVYDELRIDKIRRTASEIATWHNSGAPLIPDEHTIALFPFDGNLYNGGAAWISAIKDVSSAVDTTSGKLSYTATIPGTSNITLETRTSEDGTTWSAWAGILQDGTIQSTHQRYIQVRARLRLNGADNPSIQDITLSYDGTPTATELASGFTAGGQFFFATMLNTLIATNMLDAPKKWNGTDAVADLGGTPPHAQYIATHRNYVFMARTLANPNRLYFSEVLNFDSWPVLNFIDVSPNDGDWITGLLPYDDYLIIAKNRSIWLLMGTGPSDFEVRRIHDGVGCVAPRSLTKMAQSFVFASSEGYYMSDLSQEVLLSERLKETWRGLNQRRLNQIAAIYYDHKLRIDVPNGSSTINNLRIVYDTIQKALSLEEFSDHASCYAKFTEAGHEILLYGHSTEGQVSRADYGTTDDGQPLAMTWGTKYFNFGSSAIEKKLRYLYLVVIPNASANTLNVYLVVNGVRQDVPMEVEIPGDPNGVARTIKMDPRRIGVRKVKSIGYDIVQSSTNGGVKIHELLQEYMIRKIRETA